MKYIMNVSVTLKILIVAETDLCYSKRVIAPWIILSGSWNPIKFVDGWYYIINGQNCKNIYIYLYIE